MKRMGYDNGYQQLVERLIDLPNKIIQNHDLQHLPQIVLHYLGHDDCFGLERAAYFADNPDFDHLLGAAGFDRGESAFEKADDIWHSSADFIKAVGNSEFNKKVQGIARASVRKHNVDLGDSEDVISLAKDLGIEPPEFVSWNLKHGNHGVLIYQTSSSLDDWKSNLLKKSVEFLGFCPI